MAFWGWVKSVDGNIAAVLLTTAIALTLWLLRNLYSQHIGKPISTLQKRMVSAESRLKVIEKHQLTKTDLENLERKIDDLRRTRQADVETFERRIEREIEKASERLCDINNGMRQTIETQDKRIEKNFQILLDHIVNGRKS